MRDTGPIRLTSALVLGAALFAARTAGASPTAVVADTAVIVGANSPGPYWVSGFFIIEGSEQTRFNSNDSVPHTLDHNSGRIGFDRVLAPADTVIVTFERLGFALRSQWSLSRPQDVASEFSVTPVSYVVTPSRTPSPLRAPQSTSRIHWQGHKSFSVNAANSGGAEWSQGMELSVDGEIWKELRLLAAVTDRRVGNDTRYSAGDGARLADLDRFFMEARSQAFFGRWGELQLGQSGGSSRRVSGLETRVASGQHAFNSYVARPQGETRRVQVTLRPGDLGPYTLSGSSANGRIVDGSQTVWLDDRKLVEGPDADYTIDPARGTITLSPRLSPAWQSQLVVEYESALDQYQRTMAGGTWGWSSSDSAWCHAMSIGWEGDDPERPLFGTLTPEQRNTLEHSPSGSVTTTAAERVGDREGDYSISKQPEGDTVYIYAGPGQGEWRVRFQWVGEGKGRYRHLIDGVYEFAGNNGGSYEPILTLSAPHSQFTFGQSARLLSRRAGTFALDWQGLGTDPNRFSNGSSQFRANHAAGWSLGENGVGAGNRYGSLEWVRQSQRPVNGNFGRSLSRFGQDWRLPVEFLEGQYDDYSLRSGTPIAQWLSLQTDAGHFSSGSVSAWRGQATTELKPFDWLSLTQNSIRRWLNTSNAPQSQTTLHDAILRTQSRDFLAEAGWREEEIDDSGHHFTYDIDAASSRWLTASGFGVTARQEWRRDQLRIIEREEKAREFSVSLPASAMGAKSGMGLVLLRGERSQSGGAARPYYGGRLGGAWTPADNLQISIDADLSHRRAGAQREVFLPTRPGLGDYRYERGEYIADPQGDFRRVFVDDEAGDASAYDAAKHMRVNWRPNWNGWRWNFDLSRRVKARYAANVFAPGEWIAPWSYLSDALLPGARLMLRDDHRLTVQPRTRSRATVTLANERQLLQPMEQRSGDDQRHWRIESEWREELSSTFYFSVATKYQRRTRQGALLNSLDSDARALVTTIGYTPVAGVGLALETRRRHDREFALGQSWQLWGVRPSTRVSLGSFSGSFATDLTWLNGDSNILFSPLLAEGRPLGFSLIESVEVRWQLPSRISLNARISGDHRPDEPDRWRMQIETVATF